MTGHRTIQLTEYQPYSIPCSGLDVETALLIWRNYQSQIDVEFPSPITGNSWVLTAKGWIGFIPISDDLSIHIMPKVSLQSIFSMLNFAYGLQDVLDGLAECESMRELYESIARLLASRVVDRSRRGFYRSYVAESDIVSSVRGRLDTRDLASRGWDVTRLCHFEEHTTDVVENRILAWTLHKILVSRLCSEFGAAEIRNAYNLTLRAASLVPCISTDCTERTYNRLNQDYEPLHAVCRFFLENSCPGHRLGAHKTVPFVLNMARLYERFVARWLAANLPVGLEARRAE
jgi:5-methylcytosine-specific restriction enzyme subunit McrC